MSMWYKKKEVNLNYCITREAVTTVLNCIKLELLKNYSPATPQPKLIQFDSNGCYGTNKNLDFFHKTARGNFTKRVSRVYKLCAYFTTRYF